jgi:hypothetical protein
LRLMTLNRRGGKFIIANSALPALHRGPELSCCVLGHLVG